MRSRAPREIGELAKEAEPVANNLRLHLLAGDACEALPPETQASDFMVEVFSNIAGNAVRVRHLPTGLEATSDALVSPIANRWACFADLAIQLRGGHEPN